MDLRGLGLGLTVDGEEDRPEARSLSSPGDEAQALQMSLPGVVNDEFSRIQTLKSEEEPYRIIQLINSYCVDVDKILSELKGFIDSPDADFSKLSEHVDKVIARSSCIGAEHMRLACTDLTQACDRKDKDDFSEALDCVKNEFVHTRNKLETFAQMKQKVIQAQANQQK